MKGDFTRDTFDPKKHFTRVLMQQGRVQLDADWNEQTAILLHYLRALAADVIGPHGGPVDHSGFTILPLATGPATQLNPVPHNFVIGAGHYYVNGILCEVDSKTIPIVTFFDNPNKVQVLFWPQNGLAFLEGQYVEIFNDDATTARVQAKITQPDPGNRTLTLDTDVHSFSSSEHPSVRHLTTYLTQPDYPLLTQLENNHRYLVYLDAWERHITYLEDGITGNPNIREVALGMSGPDTATRAKLVRQVKIWKDELKPPLPDGATPTPKHFQDWADDWIKKNLTILSKVYLRARARNDQLSTDPCTISPEARYRRTENQLYRVEVHRSGPAWNLQQSSKATAATFKWSRENGSVVFPISKIGDNVVTLKNMGRDTRFRLTERDWVEIVDDDYVLQNRSDLLLKVKALEPLKMEVTLEKPADAASGPITKVTIDTNSDKHPLLRRWDHKGGDPNQGGLTLSEGAALIVEGEGDDRWLRLEDGVQVQFQKPSKDPNHYLTGDYWLIPGRTASGDVEWPREKDSKGNLVPIAKKPDGVRHSYAPLAVISIGNDGAINILHDLRRTFEPLGKQA